MKDRKTAGTEINRVFCEAYKLGGEDEEGRWNRSDKVEKELQKHLARVGFLLDKKNGGDGGLFAAVHKKLHPEKYDADARLSLAEAIEKLTQELADLFLLVKAAAFGTHPGTFRSDALNILECAYEGFKKGSGGSKKIPNRVPGSD